MWRSLGTVLVLALMAGASAHAETQQARFAVQATVRPRVTLSAIDQPANLSVSDADVARGYKDVSARYRVGSNSSRGWLLRLSPRVGVADRVEVRGLNTTVVLHQESVEVYQPQDAAPQDLALTYRLVLEPDARPGSYEVPVHVSATPL